MSFGRISQGQKQVIVNRCCMVLETVVKNPPKGATCKNYPFWNIGSVNLFWNIITYIILKVKINVFVQVRFDLLHTQENKRKKMYFYHLKNGVIFLFLYEANDWARRSKNNNHLH